MHKVTIIDIAKEAGVSKTTVSRVLNNSDVVDPVTRERVLDIIKKRHYAPSAAARNLSSQTSNTIGVIVPEVDNPFFGDILRGATKVIDSNDLMLICCNSDDNMEKDLKSLRMLKEHRVRGILYTPSIDYSSKEEKEKLVAVLNEIHIPIVLMDRKIDIGERFDGIFFNDYQGMYDATKVLIDRGHTKIGLINAVLNRTVVKMRQQGFLDAMKDSGISICPEFIHSGNYRMIKAYELSKEMLAMKDRPTAVIACNSRSSLGFLKALKERQKLEEHVHIDHIGLDRIAALDIVESGFDYIERDAKLMGEKAMQILIERMAFPNKPAKEVILDAPVRVHK